MKKVILGILAVIVIGIYYYVTIPAINIHAAGFWYFWMVVLLAAMAVCVVRKLFKNGGAAAGVTGGDIKQMLKGSLLLKILLILFGAVVVVFIAGSLLSSTFFNAAKYQQLLTVEERVFTDDIKEVDFNTIPLLDKDSAALLGDRKMGSMVDMVSQFTVSNDYTQINYQGRPVRVTPLSYASPIKWLTNNKQGIPAYMLIDMATQDTQSVKLDQGIRYSKSEYFNRYIYRHLRFKYPTYIFSDQIFFEIDDEGVPYWVCPVKKFNIGLFGGETVGFFFSGTSTFMSHLPWNTACSSITMTLVDTSPSTLAVAVSSVFSGAVTPPRTSPPMTAA